jgi:hypothetical protein
VHGRAAREARDGCPQGIVGAGDEYLVARVDQGLDRHAGQLGHPVAEEDVVNVEIAEPALGLAGQQGLAGRPDTAGVAVAVGGREPAHHLLDDRRRSLEAERRRGADVEAQIRVPRRLQRVRLVDDRTADLVSDAGELGRLTELHAPQPTVARC